MNVNGASMPVASPKARSPEAFEDAGKAIDRLEEIYRSSVDFLCTSFAEAMSGGMPAARYRAYYPEIRLTTTTFAKADSRLSFGHVAEPGTFATTVTRPDLFRNYLTQQIGLLMRNHGLPVTIGTSDTPIPVHFAVANHPDLSVPQEGAASFNLRDVFDVTRFRPLARLGYRDYTVVDELFSLNRPDD